VTIQAADRRDGEAACQLSRQAPIDSGNSVAIVAPSMASGEYHKNLAKTPEGGDLLSTWHRKTLRW
jgi:hypothetical protein